MIVQPISEERPEVVAPRPVKTVLPAGSERQRPYRVSHHRAAARGRAIAARDSMFGATHTREMSGPGTRIA